MNYNYAIEKSLHFIETHIKTKLTAEQIAHEAGYSTFHFCRIFALSQGTTLMEYVRKRRLLLAREELLDNRRIIEVALDYGFETASGFSKAFRKEFGYSPTVYICKMNSFSKKQSIKNVRRVIVNPVVAKMESFKIAGYGIKTNITKRFTKDIAAYWVNYKGDNLEYKMYDRLKPMNHGEVGVCIPCTDNNDAVYLLGVVVDDFEKVTSDMMAVTVPEAEYAIFTTPAISKSDIELDGEDALSVAVKETWEYIFNEWFPNRDYEFDETKVDFEFYDERCHKLENAVAEIYVPIIRKRNV